MKITDIVKVNISAEAPVSSRGFLNREAVACIILHMHAEVATDSTWITYGSATDATGITDQTGFNNQITKELSAWANTFAAHGGSVDQARFKRIRLTNVVTDDITTMIKNAVYGDAGTGQIALAANIIQVQLMWEHGTAVDGAMTEELLRAVAANLKGSNLVDTKLLYVTVPLAPQNLSAVSNIAWHQTAIPFGTAQVYESALSMAYYSAINFDATAQINDVEYTVWNGASLATIGGVNTVNGGFSAITSITLNNNAEHRMLIGGLTGAKTRILTEYFMIVIAQLVTDALSSLILSKTRFSEHLYGQVYSTVANVLDRFTKNQLFEANYVSEISRVINRDGVNYWTIKENELLPWGYKLVTLPATLQDRADRVYTGTVLYFALENQLRTMELNGLALGGV